MLLFGIIEIKFVKSKYIAPKKPTFLEPYYVFTNKPIIKHLILFYWCLICSRIKDFYFDVLCTRREQMKPITLKRRMFKFMIRFLIYKLLYPYSFSKFNLKNSSK